MIKFLLKLGLIFLTIVVPIFIVGYWQDWKLFRSEITLPVFLQCSAHSGSNCDHQGIIYMVISALLSLHLVRIQFGIDFLSRDESFGAAVSSLSRSEQFCTEAVLERLHALNTLALVTLGLALSGSEIWISLFILGFMVFIISIYIFFFFDLLFKSDAEKAANIYFVVGDILFALSVAYLFWITSLKDQIKLGASAHTEVMWLPPEYWLFLLFGGSLAMFIGEFASQYWQIIKKALAPIMRKRFNSKTLSSEVPRECGGILFIGENPIMWLDEDDFQQAMIAKLLCHLNRKKEGIKILEIGYGLGFASKAIRNYASENGLKILNHDIVEANITIYSEAEKAIREFENTQIYNCDWKQTVLSKSNSTKFDMTYDVIYFDANPAYEASEGKMTQSSEILHEFDLEAMDILWDKLTDTGVLGFLDLTGDLFLKNDYRLRAGADVSAKWISYYMKDENYKKYSSNTNGNVGFVVLKKKIFQ